MIVFILEINDRNIVAHEFELYEIYQNKYHLNNCCSALLRTLYTYFNDLRKSISYAIFDNILWGHIECIKRVYYHHRYFLWMEVCFQKGSLKCFYLPVLFLLKRLKIITRGDLSKIATWMPMENHKRKLCLRNIF